MSEGIQRRLAAIVSADVAGYSRLMGENEAAMLSALRQFRAQQLTSIVKDHRGKIIKSMGDGWLLAFDSAEDAVNCSVEIQVSLADDSIIKLRIGLHVGDITHEEEDIFGDGVNISARLQEMAEPGKIVISDIARRSIDGRLAADFNDLGLQNLKNIAEPINAFGWGMEATEISTSSLPLPDKPSIAVLPFDNMSDDPEQEYFADGIAEDVITALSRFRSLFVIARNSSFTYKGRAVDIAQIARELGVRYVVEGSVRKAGNRVRITAQLIHASSNNHLWADKFDGKLEDVFDLQDQITEKIVTAVEPEIEARERSRARRKPPESLDAWELLQRGLSHIYRINKSDRFEAMRLFQQATELDHDFAAAHAYLAYGYSTSALHGYAESPAAAIASARSAAEHAVSLDPNEPVARFVLGRAHVFAGEIEMAIAEMKTATTINPNFHLGHYGLGFAYYYGAGQAEKSLPHFDVSLRLNPRGQVRWGTLMLKGAALRFLGRYDEAISHCRQACQFPDSGFQPHLNLAQSLACAGQFQEAQGSLAKAKQLQPELSLKFMRDHYLGMHETTKESMLDSLRKAGLSD